MKTHWRGIVVRGVPAALLLVSQGFAFLENEGWLALLLLVSSILAACALVIGEWAERELARYDLRRLHPGTRHQLAVAYGQGRRARAQQILLDAGKTEHEVEEFLHWLDLKPIDRIPRLLRID